MSKSIWKLRWRRPSVLGWIVRIAILSLCAFIWFNSIRATKGGSFAWPEDQGVYKHTQMNPDPPIILFYWDRFCLNLNRSRMPGVHPGVPIRFAYYVHVSGLDPNPTPPWQFFQFGFVAPTWALSALAGCVALLMWSPRIFRIRPGFCANCNYNLHGLKSGSSACPECGTVASPGS